MIPKSLSDVTNDWLSTVLDRQVTQKPAVQIGQGVGLMGDIYRVELDYTGTASADLPADAPSSIVVKLPSSSAANREQGVVLGLYESEVRFYNELTAGKTTGLPQVYHAEIESGTANFVIIMEDLSELSMVSQSDGMNAAQALAAVRVIAGLHAIWWGKVQGGDLDWIPDMVGPRIDFVNEHLAQIFDGFKAGFGDELSDDVLAVYEKFIGNYPKITKRFAEGSPWTLAHQDFRVENIMFGAPGSDEVVVIDWQGMGRGPAAYDLAYLLGGSMEPELRRAHEQELLSAYHNRLYESGVTDYSLEALWEDYAHAQLMGGLAIAVLTGGALDLSNDRAKALVATMARRHGIAAVDHNGLARLTRIVDEA